MKKTLLIILLLTSTFYTGFGQNKGFTIPVGKLLIDAREAPYHQIKPGDTLYFSGGNRKYLIIRNFNGKAGNPIVMINKGGSVIIDTDHYFGVSIQNCRHIKFTGTGFPGEFYGFKVKRVANGAGIGIGYLSSDFEIDHASIENTLIAGLYAKTNPDCETASSRNDFTQYNTVIHDNYVSNTGNEGIYIGSTDYFGQTLKCNGKDTLLIPSLLVGVKVYNNIVKYTGWDGIQVSSASKDCQIHDNIVMFDSQKQEDNQMSGILMGGGTKSDCYNNYIANGNGDGIECHGLGGTRIFNNIIVNAGQNFQVKDKTKMKHGIYVTDVSVQQDSSIFIMHNAIIRPKSDGIRFASEKSKDNIIAGNVIISPGNYDYYENGNSRNKGTDAYVIFQNGRKNAFLANNYTARNAALAGFVSQNLNQPSDFQLKRNSPLIDAVDLNSKTKVTFDFLHHKRPFGKKLDIGPFEFESVAKDQIGKK